MLVRLPESSIMPGRQGQIINIRYLRYAMAAQKDGDWYVYCVFDPQGDDKSIIAKKKYLDETEARDALDAFFARAEQALIFETPLP